MSAPAMLTGLAPAAAKDARVLVLGSMPGAASLAQQQYYAHPRNAFWPIMSRLLGMAPGLPYAQQLAALNRHGVALWDVIAYCQRQGSLDSAIRQEKPNDFGQFFAAQHKIAVIAFNGGKAWSSFKRHVLPLAVVPPHIKLLTLPSTSPAHASLNFEQKLKQWQQLSTFLSS